MIDVNKRLDDAIKRYQEARDEIVHASIYLLCTLVREEIPQAKTVTLEWSDQGSWLTLNSYDDGDPDSGDEGDFGDFDDDSLASNLDDTSEGVWGKYMTDDNSGGRRGYYLLDIDAALDKSAAALAAEPPKDPTDVEEFLNS